MIIVIFFRFINPYLFKSPVRSNPEEISKSHLILKNLVDAAILDDKSNCTIGICLVFFDTKPEFWGQLPK